MMRRNIPQAPPTFERGANTQVTEVRSFELLTPMFGGGVEPRKPDPLTLIRVPSIRGQLRFWWRAANPRGCRTVAELAAAEAEVFGSVQGSTPRRSALVLSVDTSECRCEEERVFFDGDKFKTEHGARGIAYGAFPLRDTTASLKHARLTRVSGVFVLTLRYPRAIESDILAALWAWTTFGGLGGRTRRGFGAVAEEKADGLAERIKRGFAQHVRLVRGVPWPHLTTADSVHYTARPQADARAAHEFLITKLQELRQGAGVGRNPGQGRSRWPEPDEIRRLTDAHSEYHLPTHPVHAFPRAAFGLPIIFHFIRRTERQIGDPDQTTLKPRVHDRWASPLVLRPARAGASYYALAVRLGGAVPQDVVLDPTGEAVPVTLGGSQAQQVAPLNLNGKTFTDPIDRFLEEIR